MDFWITFAIVLGAIDLFLVLYAIAEIGQLQYQVEDLMAKNL